MKHLGHFGGFEMCRFQCMDTNLMFIISLLIPRRNMNPNRAYEIYSTQNTHRQDLEKKTLELRPYHDVCGKFSEISLFMDSNV